MTEKTCPQCSKAFRCKPSKAALRVYCSRPCMAAAYSVRLMGGENPNAKGKRFVCASCGDRFAHPNNTRKYCSSDCYNAMRARNAKPKRITKPVAPLLPIKCVKCDTEFMPNNRQRKYCSPACAHAASVKPLKPNHVCRHCEGRFHAYPSKNRPRKFCSYDCFIASGGAYRAGEAAVVAKVRYGAKKDANHNELVKALEKCGIPFLDLSMLGMGIPDGLLMLTRDGQQWLRFVEFKNPKTAYGRRGLNPRQKAFAKSWATPVLMVSDLDHVAAIAEGRLSDVPQFPSPKHYKATLLAAAERAGSGRDMG